MYNGIQYAFFKGSSDSESDKEISYSYIIHNADGSMTTKGQPYSESDGTEYATESSFLVKVNVRKYYIKLGSQI